MAKLVLSRDGEIIGHHFLDQERFVIGRKPGTDIFLDAVSVSKEHAAVTTVGNDQILQDLGSSNGTFVNGAKVTRHILQNGDMIEIGGYQIKYVNQKARASMDFDRTMLMPDLPQMEAVNTVAEAPSAPVVPGLSVARALQAKFPLGGVKDMRANQEKELNRVCATFGKAGEQVAVINRRPHGYFLTHVEGRKHPQVNGKAIGAEPVALQPNDLIEVGGEKLVFFLKG
jgi:pSer/pThr/pTyr-binding forkhead associated (FHA) protein